MKPTNVSMALASEGMYLRSDPPLPSALARYNHFMPFSLAANAAFFARLRAAQPAAAARAAAPAA
jgi:hypothetical protein